MGHTIEITIYLYVQHGLFQLLYLDLNGQIVDQSNNSHHEEMQKVLC